MDKKREADGMIDMLVRNADWLITMDPERRMVRDGAIAVDDYSRSSVPNIHAIGDATDDELAQLSAMFTSWLDQKAAKKTA